MPLDRLLIIFIGISSCTTITHKSVQVEPCLIDNVNRGAQCPDRFLTFEEIENFACFKPDDIEALLRR